MCPPPRSLAAEANGCFMVRVRHGPNRIQGCGARDAPDSGLPSDQSKHASTIGEQSDAIKLDTDIPIQGRVAPGVTAAVDVNRGAGGYHLLHGVMRAGA